MISQYEKLAARFGSWFGPSSLWVSGDHFLYAKGFLLEEYRRFYFEDIEAIIIQPSLARQVYTFLLVLCCGLCAFPLLYVAASWKWGFGVPLALLVVLLLINLLKGPTCTLRIVTAVSDCRIRTVHRYGRALRLRERMLRYVHTVQGGDPVPIIDEPVRAEPLRPRVRDQGLFHILSLACMAAMAALALLMMFSPSLVVVGLMSVVILISLVCSVGALVRQRNSDMPPGLKAWSWGVFGNFFVDLTLAYFGFTFALVGLSESTGLDDITQFFTELPKASPAIAGMLDFLYVFFFLCAAMLAVSGLVLIVRYLTGEGERTGADGEGDAQ